MSDKSLIDEFFPDRDGDPDWHSADMMFDINDAICTKLDGRSKAWLARKMGVSRAYVHRLLNHKVNPTLLTLAKIGLALGIKWKIIPMSMRRPVITRRKV